TVVLWVFLGQARAAAVAAVNIPLALMAAFCGMVFTGTPANLISLGAVDFGIIIEPTVIMVENVYRHLGPRGRGTLRARIVAAAALLAATGTEFMPKLEEGNFWIRATLPTSVSLETSGKHVGRMRRILLGCEDEGCTRRRNPEVRTVVSQLGRPDDGTDPSGFYNIEMFAPLIPQGKWRRGITKEKLTQQLSRDLREAF